MFFYLDFLDLIFDCFEFVSKLPRVQMITKKPKLTEISSKNLNKKLEEVQPSG